MEVQVADEELTIVISREPNRTPNIPDRQRNCSNCRDKIARAADLRNDTAGDDHTAYTKSREHDNHVHDIQIIGRRDTYGPAESSHHRGSTYHDHLDLAARERDEDQGDNGAADDSEADREGAQADANGVAAVDVVYLGGPEQEENEELKMYQLLAR